MQLGGCVVIVSTVLISALILSSRLVSASKHAPPRPGDPTTPGSEHRSPHAVHDAATQTQSDSAAFVDDVSTLVDDEDVTGGNSLNAILSQTRQKHLMLVSTLDGKLSALDADSGGALIWSINVGAKPLLSSSISNIELFRNGRSSKLIPSLDGSLYQFNGDDMERLPFNADTLLSSSTKLTEDTMVVGSRDVAIFGISPYSGQVKYICGSEGCGHNEDSSGSGEDIITVKRKSHTVRAIHISTGEEKWNFSVGQDDIEFVDSYGSDSSESILTGSDVPVKVYVPDGVIVASNEGSEKELWRYQFSSPISKAWKLQDGSLEEISVFDCKYVPSLHDGNDVISTQPMIFFGMHHGQLYVQPSVSGAEHPQVALDEYIKSFVDEYGREVVRHIPKIRWKPYLSSAPSRTPHLRNMVNLLDYDRGAENRDRHSSEDDYPYDSGYYLVPDITYLPDYIPALEGGDDDSRENETDYLIYINESIWVWWKEIIAISLCTSIMVQVLMNRVFFRHKETSTSESSQKERTISESSRGDESEYQRPGGSFVSRFHTDFEVIETLGRGGFGVVFKAKNKMDELEYAVKRICVKNTPESRDKVLREARAMAKLEHVGIIRYHQVFVETPPEGWQRLKDLELFGPDISSMSTSHVTETPMTDSVTEEPKVTKKFSNPLHIDEEDESRLSEAEGFVKAHYDVSNTNSLEIVFENSEDVPFRRYRTSENQCDSGCSDVSTRQDDVDVDLSTTNTTSNRKRTISLTSGSGSFSVHEDEVPPEPVIEKPPKLYLYIQMQLCERQTLKDWLSANTLNRDHKKMLDYFTQIVIAVSYVHEKNLIHRDLKPSNIYFSVHDNDIIKIGDFGLVTAHEDKAVMFDFDNDDESATVEQHTNQVGTQLYMSPEQMEGLPYDQKVDIFSLGLIFLEFFYPCSTQMEKITVLSDAKRGKLPFRFTRELKTQSQFVRWLLSADSSQRPTAVEMLESELLKDVIPSSLTGLRNNPRKISANK